jgi:succinyl-diaminopimelate desuccinylase
MHTIFLIKKLVSFVSLTKDKSAVNRCADFTASYLKKRGLFVEVFKKDGYRIVYASTHGSMKCDVLLNAHLDVVNAEPEQFRAVERNGRLFGRGVVDCKGHAAVIMNLLPKLGSDVRVGAIFTTDEETGGITTRHAVKMGCMGKLVIILDGGIDRVNIAQKGILALRLTARGKAGHASTPWKADNAIERLLKGYQNIKKLFPKIGQENTWKNSCALTMINGGVVTNQVPDRAEMNLNIRYTGRDDRSRLLKKIGSVSGLRIECLHVSPLISFPKKDVTIKKFHASMRKRLNPRITMGRMNGATDARHFAKAGRSVVITGLKGEGAHSKKEWLNIKSVSRLEKALYGFIKEDF